MAIKPKKIDDGYSVIVGDINSPNLYMETILDELYVGDATNISENLEKVRWMTADQAIAFSMYFRSTPSGNKHPYKFFEFIGSHNGRGNKKQPLKEIASLNRGEYLHQLWLSHNKAGKKIKLESLYDIASENWPKKDLGGLVSPRTLRNDFARYRRTLKQASWQQNK